MREFPEGACELNAHSNDLKADPPQSGDFHQPPGHPERFVRANKVQSLVASP